MHAKGIIELQEKIDRSEGRLTEEKPDRIDHTCCKSHRQSVEGLLVLIGRCTDVRQLLCYVSYRALKFMSDLIVVKLQSIGAL
jgi:hypothetical protein